MLKTPQFWQRECRASKALAPCSWVYQRLSTWRHQRIKPQKVSVPVVCVGNVVMGGAGKTPTVLALSRLLKEMGRQPHVLSRGYGGYYREVVQVQTDQHSYAQVGDESLLLARSVPTWIGANRVHAAQKAIRSGADILIMDDGFQNPHLHKDLSILVIDSLQGTGNGRIFPAGPLREPLSVGLQKSHWVITIGEEQHKAGGYQTLIQEANIPHLKARIQVVQTTKTQQEMKEEVSNKTRLETKMGMETTTKTDSPKTPHHQQQRIVAFAGMGFPEKFRQTLLEMHYNIVDFVTFPDHYPYTVVEVQSLVQKAKKKGCTLMTTEKDYLRIPISCRGAIQTLPVQLVFEDDLQGMLQRWLASP